MVFRPVTLLCVLAAVLLAPAAAWASDPLLSGYGGPGGGEQVVLGSKLLGGGGGGGGPAGGATLQAAPAPTRSTPAGDRATRGPGTPSTTATDSASTSLTTTPHPSDQRSAPADVRPSGAPAVVPYPAGTQQAGMLPFSGGDLALLLGGAALLLLLAAALRRLTLSGGSRPAS